MRDIRISRFPGDEEDINMSGVARLQQAMKRMRAGAKGAVAKMEAEDKAMERAKLRRQTRGRKRYPLDKNFVRSLS